MKEALIATISTVVGTLLGWVLANIKTGKINISIDNFIETAHYTNPSSVYIPGKENYEIYGLTLTFDIQLHNSSATNKAIRDCILIFLDAQGNELLSEPVCDLATRHKYGGGYKSDPIAVINVEAYKSYNIRWSCNTLYSPASKKADKFSSLAPYRNRREIAPNTSYCCVPIWSVI